MSSSSSNKKPVYGEFDAIEAKRPDYKHSDSFPYTKSPANGTWIPGSGATDDEWKKHKKVSFDPDSPERDPRHNYQLLVSAIIPRPIGFISTTSKDGVDNIAPFSFFNVLSNDPITFAVGISKNTGNVKDTAKHLNETKEATINIISEWFSEAANFTSTGSPIGVSEWELSGLTKEPSKIVRPPLVAESAFSVEAKVTHVIPVYSERKENFVGSETFILQAVRVHVREDITNEDLTQINIGNLKPVARLGGVKYGPITSAYELPRPDYTDDVAKLASGSKEKL